MLTSSPTNRPAKFVCACDEDFHPACGEPYSEKYCVIHHPDGSKADAFRRAVRERLGGGGGGGELNLRGAWFPERLDLRGTHFHRPLSFTGAFFNRGVDFSGCVFEGQVSFKQCTFREAAQFDRAEFKEGAYFLLSKFEARAGFAKITCRKKASFEDALFQGAADFSSARFCGESRFHAARFRKVASFSLATFRGPAGFTSASFGGAIPNFDYAPTAFIGATFLKDADFSSASFPGDAVFADGLFQQALKMELATFDARVDFGKATFNNYVTFIGTNQKPVFSRTASLDLRHVKVERPDRVSFQTPHLLPHWFVNVDVRKFDFPDVQWWRNDIKQEILNLKGRRVLRPHRRLAIACQQLALNAEENGRYTEASQFRFWSMEARRREHLLRLGAAGKMFGRLGRSLGRNRDRGQRGRTLLRCRRFGGLILKRNSNDLLYRLYWAASGYGEKVRRAFAVLLLIFVLFAAAYTQVGFSGTAPAAPGPQAAAAARVEGLAPSEALTYSLGVMTLQRPDPKPATAWARALVLAETILGPLQAALLALAIRRQFMR